MISLGNRSCTGNIPKCHLISKLKNESLILLGFQIINLGRVYELAFDADDGTFDNVPKCRLPTKN
jgi:hypothetical protein